MHGLRYHHARLGRERCEGSDLARHRHRDGYLTLVLAGTYVEAGDAGRYRVQPGDVLIHRPFEAHRDLFARRSADLLNLPLPDGAPDAGAGRAADPDAVARLAERDLAGAAQLLCATLRRSDGEGDWPDLLAAALRRPGEISIGGWARRQGLDPASVSRGFRQAFGTTPSRYRAEARARLAAAAIGGSRWPLAQIAFELGFADQAHMTRAVAAITGLPPRQWRRGQIDSRPGPAADLG